MACLILPLPPQFHSLSENKCGEWGGAYSPFEIQIDSSLAYVDYGLWIRMERDLSQSINVSLLWVRSVIKRALHKHQAPAKDALTTVTPSLSRSLSEICQESKPMHAIRPVATEARFGPQ